MKTFFGLWLFSLSAVWLAAQSETIDLRSRGKLTLYFPGNWSISTAEFGERIITTIGPKDEAVNANCTLTVTFPEPDRGSTKARLRQQVEVASAPYAEGSVEGKAVARELTVRTGYGYFCSFTDPELVGKPPVKGNFKVISVGMIHVAPDILVEVAISADGFRSEPYQQLLGAVEGMEHEPRRQRSVQRTSGPERATRAGVVRIAAVQ